MPSNIYTKPRFFFTVSLPLVRETGPQRWLRIRKCSIGYFGCSPATNTTWRVVFFGWVLCEWKRHEYHDSSDKERADRYLAEWSKCEKELRSYKLVMLGENMDAEVKKLIRDSMGVDFDEGRSS